MASTSPNNNNNNGSSNTNSSDYLPQPIADAESTVAKALITLSTNEREKVLEEIHGVVTEDKLIENEHFISQMLNKMKEQKMTNNIAYKTATKMSPTFVQDPIFRLMFLRSEEYNVKAACQRLMNYLEFKLVLFGPEKLTKEITLNDLSKDTHNCST